MPALWNNSPPAPEDLFQKAMKTLLSPQDGDGVRMLDESSVGMVCVGEFIRPL